MFDKGFFIASRALAHTNAFRNVSLCQSVDVSPKSLTNLTFQMDTNPLEFGHKHCWAPNLHKQRSTPCISFNSLLKWCGTQPSLVGSVVQILVLFYLPPKKWRKKTLHWKKESHLNRNSSFLGTFLPCLLAKTLLGGQSLVKVLVAKLLPLNKQE